MVSIISRNGVTSGGKRLVKPSPSGLSVLLATMIGIGAILFRCLRATLCMSGTLDLQSGRVFQMIESLGFEIRAQIIWVKSGPTFGRGHYHWQHEACYFAERQAPLRKEHDPCYYAVREGGDAKWQGSRTESTVWETGVDLQDVTIHSTQKPLAVMIPPIKHHTAEGDLVYDPFLGSGTTMIAAQQLGRVCYGIEIKPEFVDVTIARFQRYCDEKIYYQRDGERHLLAE